MSYKLFYLFITISLSYSFFQSDTPVTLLYESNFDKEVIESKNLWLILFYAPSCEHCKTFTPEYEKAAKVAKGLFKIGAVDASKEKQLGLRYDIKELPTLKFFGVNKKKPEIYNSERKAESIIDFMFEKARSITNKRLGKKSKKTTNANIEDKQQKANENEKDVIELTDDNFDSTVFNDENMWMIVFYAPWCEYCKNLLIEWNEVATQLKGTVKLAKVDCSVQKQLESRYEINKLPTIKIFPPGKKDKKEEEYGGQRDLISIITYALDKLERFGYVPETKQLIDREVLKDECESNLGICIIIFLSHISNSSAKERNKQLKIIKEVRKKYIGRPIYYLWAQGGDYFDFEEKLHLDFGYPAVVAVDYKKKMYSVCRNSFSKKNLTTFISNLLNGKEHLNNLPDGIKIKKVDKWDGKDYIPSKEKSEEL